jgi:hypothetical protein
MIEEMMTTLSDLNGYLDDEAYTVRVGELRALLATPAPLSDEPVAIYQMRVGLTGDWRDQDEAAYLYNAKHCPQDTRIVYAAPPATPSDKQEAVGEVLLIGKDSDLKEVAWRKGKMPPVGTKLYAAPLANPSDKQEARKHVETQPGSPNFDGAEAYEAYLNAQSAEQDRIDAERWRYARQLQRRPDEYDAYIDRQRAKGASK